MTVGTARGPASARTTGRAYPRPAAPAVTRIAVRQVLRGTAVVTLVCGGLVAVVVTQYRGLDGAIGLSSLSSLADNPAIRTLFGRADALDDPGGFTVWRTGTLVAVLVGTWAVLTATRLTRGEEEAGRWELLLAGRLPLRALVLRTLAVVLAAAMLPGVGVALGLLLAGTATTGAVLYGAAIAGVGLTGAALGVLAAQLLPERRAASGLATVVFLAGLLARMVADGVPAFSWLHWVTPFGLLSRTAAFAEDRFLPLALLAALAALFGVTAVALAAGRDVGAGRLATREHGRAPSRLLRSLPGFAVHRTRRPVGTWGVGIGAYFLLIGLLATAMMDFLRENPLFAEFAERAGFAQLASVGGYVASIFALLAIPVGAFASARLAASAHDESAGRLALLYSRPVSRVRWLVIESLAVVAGCVVLAAVAGLATWIGTVWVRAELELTDALAGALSVVPVALLCLGAAMAALGWAPQAVLALGVLPAAGGYLLLVLADSFRWPSWVRGLSPFDHLAAVPVEPFDVAGALGMLAVALLFAVLGLVGYHLRDLRG